ncbi:MAG: capsular biosynthesis protein [Bacteroidetes bacterium]|jgi:tyrosine-protein phosphatase YwqE|nr:capsular biosynthesis protein [Bacteroidota bacterium]
MNLFSNLFKKSRLGEPFDLGLLNCDVHSHFIPGIDDGSKSMKDSIELLKAMEDFGFKKVITTPHVMSDFFRNTSAVITTGLEQVRNAAKAEGIEMEIEAAAEYYYDYELEGKMKNERLLTFGLDYLLFEVSYMNAPDNLDEFIFQLQTSGYKPVLAHPERYPFWFTKNLEHFEKLKDKGVFFQLNICALAGHYSPDTKKVAEQMIDRGWYEFLGSDCHHMGHIEIMKRVRTEKYLEKLINSGKLLNSTL